MRGAVRIRGRMQTDIERAKAYLKEGYTLALCKEEEIYTSKERGVKALLYFYDEGLSAGFSAADNVVGRGAAFLYALLGVKEVYAKVLSESAKDVLDKFSVPVTCEVLVPRIINRDKTGFCPIEEAVLKVQEPLQAVCAIKNRIKELKTI